AERQIKSALSPSERKAARNTLRAVLHLTAPKGGWIHVSKSRHLPRDPSKLRQFLHRSRSQRCNFSCIPSLATLSAQPTSGSAFAPASKTTSAASCMRVGDLEPGTPLLPVHKCIN